MKNKPRIKPSLRSLSDSDRELLANWLRTDHYDGVLERVRKPRSEGSAASPPAFSM